MEINVRDYIRTNEGNIGIVLSFYCRNEEANIWRIRIKYKNGDEEEICSHLQVKKYSKDIIDLIEVGDLITVDEFKGIYEVKKYGYELSIVVANQEQDTIYNLNSLHCKLNIKSILTHEQFTQNAYVLEKEV